MEHSNVRISIGLVMILLGGILAASAGQPGHYIVVEVDPEGWVEPVFCRSVELASIPSLSAEQQRSLLSTATEGEALAVDLITDDGVVFRDVVHISRFVHGEFHGDSTLDGFTIEHSRHISDRGAVVLRLPAVPDAQLRVSGQRLAVFDLDALSDKAGDLPLAQIGDGSRMLLHTNGNSANRVDLLIMGDGYTSAQAALFATDAAGLETSFFSISPYAEYRNYVNTSALFTASVQAGADHPPYNAGCTAGDLSCCGDSLMLSDPLAGNFVSTAFDGHYCAYNIHRLLVVDTSKVFAAAAAAPDWDQIFVLVNDPTYGGSGGAIAVASTHALAPDVIRHEYGHSFSDLADEYESAYPGYPGCSDISGPGCEANVTDETNRVLVKWEPWIDPATPVPTPEGGGYASDVGVFQGARYQSSGMYRPRESCLMRSLGVSFCEVCTQAYVLKLYEGGWGVPAGGIDPIEPGSESPSTISTVIATGSVTLSVAILEPVGGPSAAIEWTVDSQVQAGATSSSFVFAPAASGTFTVTVRVSDMTTLVHQALTSPSMSDSRTWIVEVSGIIFSDGFESGDSTLWSSTVP